MKQLNNLLRQLSEQTDPAQWDKDYSYLLGRYYRLKFYPDEKNAFGQIHQSMRGKYPDVNMTSHEFWNQLDKDAEELGKKNVDKHGKELKPWRPDSAKELQRSKGI